MAGSEVMHIGRCWSGDEKAWFGEDCTCEEMAPCGAALRSYVGVFREKACPQHDNGMRTLRRVHKESKCPNLT